MELTVILAALTVCAGEKSKGRIKIRTDFRVKLRRFICLLQSYTLIAAFLAKERHTQDIAAKDSTARRTAAGCGVSIGGGNRICQAAARIDSDTSRMDYLCG